jgi:UDP-N-acetyl-D-mannosaminuronic acid transferase (WecB/TagA/CpsF family)
MRAMRLNWLYRLSREPRRLWKRYTVELAGSALMVARARFAGQRPADGARS